MLNSFTRAKTFSVRRGLLDCHLQSPRMLMSKLVYLLILVGAGIAALGAKELMVYGWDRLATIEIAGGAGVVVMALCLSGLTRWR